jgi:hypothetical protein
LPWLLIWLRSASRESGLGTFAPLPCERVEPPSHVAGVAVPPTDEVLCELPG